MLTVPNTGKTGAKGQSKIAYHVLPEDDVYAKDDVDTMNVWFFKRKFLITVAVVWLHKKLLASTLT